MYSKVFSSSTIHSFGSFHVIFYTLGFHFFAQNYHPPRPGLKKSKALPKLIPVTSPHFLDKNAMSFAKKAVL